MSRTPKQDFGFVEELLDVLEETPTFSEDFEETGRRHGGEEEQEQEQEQERSGRTGGGAPFSYDSNVAEEKEEVENEKCEETNPSETVNVCLPGFEVKSTRLYLGSEETYEEKYCYAK